MPSNSAKQHRFMEAIAHNQAFAKKVGVPQSVGQDFAKADKGKTFKKGGDMKESKKMVEKEVSFMKKKGAPASMIKHEMSEEMMKRGGKVKKMAAGGMTNPKKDPRVAAMMGARRAPAMPGGMPMGAPAPTMAPPPRPMAPAPAGPAAPAPTMGMKKGGRTPVKGDHPVQKKAKVGAQMVKMATGGYVKSADGVAERGRTRFSQPKMKGRVI